MSRLALATVLFAIPAFVACGGSSSAPASTAAEATTTVKGTVALSAYAGLDNPVVISRSVSGRVFVAPVMRTGAFQIDLPSNEAYRFSLANTRRDRTYAAVSEIRWDGAAWGTFPANGGSLDFGTIRPVGSNATAPISAGNVTAQDHGGDTSGGGSSGGGGGGDTSTSGGGGGGSSSGGGADDSASSGSSSSTCSKPGAAKLPYDVKPQLGQTFRLTDAFFVEGPMPASVNAVTMDGGSWRLTELQANTPFVITQDDCNHQGNRDIGRDRVFITWTNAGGGQQTDHLDLRYCEAGNRVPDDAAAAAAMMAPSGGECPVGDTPTCTDASSATPESECTGDHMKADHDDDDSSGAAPVCGGASGAGGGAVTGGDSSATGGSGAGATGGSGAGATGGSGAGATGGSGAGGTASGATGGATTGGAATGGGGVIGRAAGPNTNLGGTVPSGTTSTGGAGSGAGDVPAGGGCVTNADCNAGLACFASTCVNAIK